jgi:hypothetical protein
MIKKLGLIAYRFLETIQKIPRGKKGWLRPRIKKEW